MTPYLLRLLALVGTATFVTPAWGQQDGTGGDAAGTAAEMQYAAPQEPIPEPEPRNELRVDLGVGSPTGAVGVTLSRWFAERATVEAGVGYGWTGVQLSLMPKVAFVRGRHVFTVGVGPSGSLPLDPPPGVTPLLWMNAEVGYQARMSSTWMMAFAAGVASGLGGHMHRFFCLSWFGDCSPLDIQGLFLPTVRVGVGRRF